MRLYIADPSLGIRGGHHESFNRLLAGGAVALGLEPILLANVGCKFRMLGGAKVQPVFRYDTYGYTWGRKAPLEPGLLLRSTVPAFAQDLSAALKENEQEAQVLCHSCGPFELADVVTWLTDMPTPSSGPRVHFGSFCALDAFVDPEEFTPVVTGVQALTRRGESLNVYAHTQALASYQTESLGLHTKYAPQPTRAFGGTAGLDGGRAIEVVFPGEARGDKGFHLLPELLTKLMPIVAREGWDVVFTAQAYNSDGDPRVLKTLKKLRSWKFRKLRLLKRPLSDVEYEALLRSADLVVLPYDADSYRRRPSGVALEAVASGKIVIFPGDTSIGSLLSRYDIGIAYPVGHLLESVVRGLRDRALLKRALDDRGSVIREHFSPEAMLRAVLGLGVGDSEFAL
jgi:hypothetical protein